MPANTTGTWESLMNWPLVGIHAIITQDGKVLSFGTDQNGIQGATMYHDLWDPITNTHQLLDHHTTTVTDIFCANGIVIPGTDKILISGGDARPLGSTNTGVADVNVFNTTTNQITPDTHGKMAFARWYSTAINLPNGQVLVLGGSDFTGAVVKTPEIYTVGEGWKTLTGATDQAASAQYDRAFVNKDGKVVYFNRSGNIMLLDTAGTGTVSKIGTLPFAYNWESPAIQYQPGKILINDAGTGLWTMDINGAAPTFTKVGTLASERNYANMTVLADGKVLINGGSIVTNQDTSAVKTSVLWNPATNTVSTLVDEAVPRLYHSTSVLLADGTVLSMGGGSFGGPNPNVANQLNAQIYKPAYLFDQNGNAATRPEIVDVPDHVQSGTTFTITVGNAADIQKITLVKAGATTHDFNMNAGFTNLSFTVGPNNTLVISLPGVAQGVTAGSWMVFVWNTAGVPAIAPVIEIDPVFNTGAVVDPANLLTNGSFEAASVITTNKILDDFVGWYSTKNNFEIWKSGFNGVTAKDGATVIEVDADRGLIWQTVKTKSGQTYDVTFDFSGRPGAIASSKMEVLWNGVVIATISPTDATFQTYTFKVTGTGGKDQIGFRALASDTDALGGLLDKVVLKPGTAPAPADLIVNGDMEAQQITSAAGWDDYTNAEVTGWKNAGADNVVLVNYNGSQMLDLDPEGAADELYQTVQTKAGTSYTLSFSAIATQAGSSAFDVLWNGVKVATVDPSTTTLQTFTYKVTGTGGLDKLSFRELASQNDFLGSYLDKVKLIEGQVVTPPANLIVNGNIELPKITSTAGWQDYRNAQMSGWKNTGADNVVIVDYLGSQMLDLDPEGAADELYQTVQTTAAQTYTLSFEAIATKAGSSAFDVLWNGVKLATVNPSETQKQSFTYTVTGTGGLDKLSFRELATQNDFLGSYLDNVKLVVGSVPAAPAPFRATLVAHDGNHVMGTSGNDLLKGTSDLDHIMGGAGNDRMLTYSGNDVVDGGLGKDIVQIAARPRELKISKNADGSYTIKTATQTVTAENVEFVTLKAGAESFGTFAIEALRKALATPVDAAHKHSNLLANASFEKISASAPDGAARMHVSDAAMSGWTSSKGGFEIWHDGFRSQPASKGHNAVEVDAVDGAISQKVSTQAHHIYALTFDFAGQIGHVSSSDVAVVWNGKVIKTIDPSDSAFHHYAVSVTGTGGNDILTFRAVSGDTDSHGGLLDNVNLHDFSVTVI